MTAALLDFLGSEAAEIAVAVLVSIEVRVTGTVRTAPPEDVTRLDVRVTTEEVMKVDVEVEVEDVAVEVEDEVEVVEVSEVVEVVVVSDSEQLVP